MLEIEEIMKGRCEGKSNVKGFTEKSGLICGEKIYVCPLRYFVCLTFFSGVLSEMHSSWVSFDICNAAEG